MKAMLLEKQKTPLTFRQAPNPVPSTNEVLVKIKTCGVCRTDLHVVDGDLTHPSLPLIPGHEIVGTIESLGSNVSNLKNGQRVGIPWLGATCGVCTFCTSKRENLCDNPTFTGYTKNGGYAEYTTADARFVFPLPESYSDSEIAPLLCAGLIGWRSLKIAGAGKRIGFYGFGAAAHILIQVALHQKREVYCFTRAGDSKGQDFARSLGATWAGASEDTPPQKLDAAIIFAPVGALVLPALKALGKGGIVVCGGIHMSDIPQFPYDILWDERSIKSVANLTRNDAREFLDFAAKHKIHTTTTQFALSEANKALDELRAGQIKGAAVLVVDK